MSLEKCEKILVFMGKSASGKDTLVKKISEEFNIPIALSFTTRPMRSGEAQGVEYNFISEKEMERKLSNNEIMEYTEYYIKAEDRTYMYGSSLEELTKDKYVLVIVNPIGLYQLKHSPLKDKIVTFLLECNDEVRLIRSLEREDNIDVAKILERFIQDEEDFKNVETDFVINTCRDLSEVYSETKEIIRKVLKGE